MNQTEHLLVILAEECAEVAQRAAKALRFGLGEIQPGPDATTAARLLAELDDLHTVAEMLVTEGALPRSGVVSMDKVRKVERFLDYSSELGILEAMK
jgi:hypothetical protein